MRSPLKIIGFAIVLIAGVAGAGGAVELDGTLKLGGVIVDEDAGDLSVMQETFNIYEGFAISQIRLNAGLTPKTYLNFDLRDINRDNRKGMLDFRVPGRMTFRTSYDQNRQVFDPQRVVTSDRKDWRVGARITPIRWLQLSANYNLISREGDRFGFPLGIQSQLGSRYDYRLQLGRIEAQVTKDARAFALAYDISDYSDDLSATSDRRGQVVSARLYTPDPLTDKVAHVFRAAYGEQELSNSDLSYTLKNFQYNGIVAPSPRVQWKYGFYASRVDDDATGLKTDNFRHDIDATYRYRHGSLSSGYGYEINDDDRSLTRYHVFRGSASYRYPDRFSARLRYTNRTKQDEEELTLLKDSETQTVSAKIEVRPIQNLIFGGAYSIRDRELPDIDVKADGQILNVFLRREVEMWGSFNLDYTYARDEFLDRVGSFETRSHILTSRAEVNHFADLVIAGGATVIDVNEDLDIEKSILFVEATYSILENYRVEVRYNVYNYDDFILLDRYYTANIVWINFAYDFRKE